MTRLYLAVAVGGITFIGAVGLLLLWKLLGDVVWDLTAVAIGAGVLVWLVDFTSELLDARKKR